MFVNFSSLIDESEETKKLNLDEDQTQPQLPSDEDMEDILEHIDEDVEIPDDDEEDLEDTDMITDTIPMLKEKIEPEDEAPINVVTTSPNGHSSEMPISLSGSLPKLPPLPPIPPPLLNLEFLKVPYLTNFFLKKDLCKIL